MQLHYKESGQGKAVVLLHGLFGSLDNFYYLTQKLAAQFRVIAVDQRNHGQSPHSEEMSYRLMADDLAELLERLEVKSTAVLGHSMGGKTAMQFALQYPHQVERLIVADMAPRAYQPSHLEIFAALKGLDLSLYDARPAMEEALAPAIPSQTLRRFLLKNLGRDQTGKFFWKISLPGLAKNYKRLLAPIEMAAPYLKPTLFIRGGKSDYIYSTDEPLIHELFPAAAMVNIPEAGHWLHADRPEEFNRLVWDFLCD